jgi:pilus assembly protein Flp/PilA
MTQGTVEVECDLSRIFLQTRPVGWEGVPVITHLKELLFNDDGATLVEYAFVVALIALVCVTAVTTLGTKVKTIFTDMGTDI